MSVHQKKDGRWFVKWPNPDPPPPAKYKYFGFGIEAERQARAFNETLGLRPYTFRTPARLSPTFTELVNAYGAAKVGQLSDVSMDNWLYKMNGVILPEIGHLAAAAITPHRLDQYVQKRLRTPLTVRTGSPENPGTKTLTRPDGSPRTVKRTTVHRELTDIQAVMNWALDRGYITRNPIARYKKPARDDAVCLPPTQKEVEAILAHAPEHLLRAIVVCYYTGLRPGQAELFGLTWEDLDWQAGTILVRSAKKGGIRYRMVPVHENFLAMLKTWCAADRNTGLVVHFNGARIGSIKRSWATAKKKAGITRRLRPYDIRHAFATELLRRSADLKTTSEMIGHTRTDTTTRIYQHVDGSLQRATINRLPALQLKNSCKKTDVQQPDKT